MEDQSIPIEEVVYLRELKTPNDYEIDIEFVKSFKDRWWILEPFVGRHAVRMDIRTLATFFPGLLFIIPPAPKDCFYDLFHDIKFNEEILKQTNSFDYGKPRNDLYQEISNDMVSIHWSAIYSYLMKCKKRFDFDDHGVTEFFVIEYKYVKRDNETVTGWSKPIRIKYRPSAFITGLEMLDDEFTDKVHYKERCFSMISIPWEVVDFGLSVHDLFDLETETFNFDYDKSSFGYLLQFTGLQGFVIYSVKEGWLDVFQDIVNPENKVTSNIEFDHETALDEEGEDEFDPDPVCSVNIISERFNRKYLFMEGEKYCMLIASDSETNRVTGVYFYLPSHR